MVNPPPNNLAYKLAREPFMDLVRELVWTSQRFEALDKARIRKAGLTTAQFDVLATLGNTEGMTLSCIAQKTLLTKSSLTGITDRLEEKGLVRREVPEGDRRCCRAVLTEKGEALFHEVFPAQLLYLKSFLDKISEEDQATIKASLRQLREALTEEP